MSVRAPAAGDVKTLVFDFAGVVFGWHPPTMLRREIPHLAHDDASAAHWERELFQGWRGDWLAFDLGRVGVDELVATIARRTGAAPADVRRVVDAVPHELVPMPDTLALLERLRRQGRRLVFLSNMPEPYVDHLEREHPLARWFDDGVFSSRVHEAKPAPAIFHLAARRFGSAPAQMVFFDDMAANVEAARALGWNALRFTDAAGAEAALREHGWM